MATNALEFSHLERPVDDSDVPPQAAIASVLAS